MSRLVGETGLGGYEAWGNPLSAFLPRRKRADLSEGRTARLAPFENASLVAVTGPGAYLGVSFMKLLCFLSLSGSTDPILTESHCFSYSGFGIGKSHDRIWLVNPNSPKQLRAFECDRCICYLKTILVNERWEEILQWTPNQKENLNSQMTRTC